jgi:hypothetical protein
MSVRLSCTQQDCMVPLLSTSEKPVLAELSPGKMTLMSCNDEEDARREAADCEISDDEATRLSGLCMRKFRELGNAGVRGHSVEFSVTA